MAPAQAHGHRLQVEHRQYHARLADSDVIFILVSGNYLKSILQREGSPTRHHLPAARHWLTLARHGHASGCTVWVVPTS